MQCPVCNRRLRSEKSLARGVGPVCEQRLKDLENEPPEGQLSIYDYEGVGVKDERHNRGWSDSVDAGGRQADDLPVDVPGIPILFLQIGNGLQKDGGLGDTEADPEKGRESSCYSEKPLTGMFLFIFTGEPSCKS